MVLGIIVAMRTVQTDISSKLQLLNLWIFQRYVSFELLTGLTFGFFFMVFSIQGFSISKAPFRQWYPCLQCRWCFHLWHRSRPWRAQLETTGGFAQIEGNQNLSALYIAYWGYHLYIYIYTTYILPIGWFAVYLKVVFGLGVFFDDWF